MKGTLSDTKFKQGDVMKTNRMLLAALLFCTTAAFTQAQSFYPSLKKASESDMERLDKAYAWTLTEENNGTTEMALAIVSMIKLDLPSGDFARIKSHIDDLTLGGATPVIRYKASLASAVFMDPEMFREESQRTYQDEDAFFSALAQRMTKTLLSAK